MCGDVCVSVGGQDPVKAKMRERVESRKAVHKETTSQVDKRKDFEAAVSHRTVSLLGSAPVGDLIRFVPCLVG